MGRRQLIPISLGGVGLTTMGRRAFFEYDEGAFSSPFHEPIIVESQGRFPSHLRLQPEGKTFPLRFVIRNDASQNQFRAISKICDPTLGEQTLILEDSPCPSPRQYRLTCVPQQIVVEERSDKPLVVPLWAADPILLDNTQTSSTDTITNANNPATFSLRNVGSYRSLPTLTAKATSQKLAAEGYTRMMEISYANRSELSLTGPGSGTWLLMLIENWDTATLISGGEMETDGRDIAVFVDQVQVPPEKVEVVNINTANTKVWIDLSDSPAHHADLEDAITGATTVFTFRTRDHGFRVGDYLVWEDNTPYTPSIERARVTAVDGDQVTVVRGVRNTTAGSADAGTRIYRSGHDIQMAWGRTGLSARPTNPDPPLIDLENSDNLHWEWASGPLWPDENRRAGGWRRILYNGRDDVPELRKNKLSAKTVLSLATAAEAQTASQAGEYTIVENDVKFSDLEPSASFPNFDAVEFTACCGVDDSAGAIEYDAALGWPFAFQIIGRDFLGYDIIVFNRLGHETGAAHFPPRLYTNQQETPDEKLSAVVFRARQLVVATARPTDATEEDLALIAVSGHDLQKITLDEETQVIGMVFRARDDANSGNGIESQINEIEDDAPGSRIAGPFSGAAMLTTFHEVCFIPGDAAGFTTDLPILAAGEYFLSIAESTGGGEDYRIPISDGSVYGKGEHWEHDGSDFVRDPDADIWFALLSLNTDNQEETLNIARTGEHLYIRNISITFDPDRVPLLDTRPAEDAYYYDTTWTRGSQVIHLRFLKRWADAQDETVTVDIDEGTVTDDESGDNIRAAVEVNNDPWLSLLPGNNTVNVEAVNGAQGEEHTIAYRNAWLA